MLSFPQKSVYFFTYELYKRTILRDDVYNYYDNNRTCCAIFVDIPKKLLKNRSQISLGNAQSSTKRLQTHMVQVYLIITTRRYSPLFGLT